MLVHGDVSPKNIMLGPDGPILLDAECAWFGDPAFDLAFCLNHFLIKRLVVKGAADALAAAFDALVAAYLAHVDWEPAEAVEARAAALLPVLALARVDGKSPVEYLDEAQRGAVARAGAPGDQSAANDAWRCTNSMFAVQPQQPASIPAHDLGLVRLRQMGVEADRVRLGHVEGIVGAEAQMVRAVAGDEVV